MAIRRFSFFSFTGPFFFLLFSLQLPVRALDWTVDITTDQNDLTCAPGDCSLREAIAAAGDGDTILFALPDPSPWTITLNNALGQLAVTNDITLTGPGATQLAISGGNLVRVMTIQVGAAVSLSGLTLRDGRATTSGDKHGGCLKVLGEVTVSSSRFESCQAWNGGVSSNTAGGDGGGVYVAAGGVFTGSQLVFSGDVAGVGGGSLDPPTAVFAGGRGGALANAGFASLWQTTVAGCTAGAGGGPWGPGGDGGGIANLAGGVLLLGATTLSGNRSGDGAVFTLSGADGRGGGLYCQGDCTLNNVTLSGNSVGTSAVGAVAQGGGLFVGGGTTRLRNVTVAGNTANSTGGGIARAGGGSIITRTSLFAGNTGGGSPDCASATASLISEGYNLIRVNNGCASSFGGTDQEGTSGVPLEPLLAALGANGGPTETRALGAGSPAIDGGDPLGCASWNPVLAQDEPMGIDQRGELRPTDGDGDAVATCDTGAYEAAGVAPVQHLLEVTVAGAGAGSVTSSPVGIDCPGDCDESWVLTQNVELAATPDPGSYFVGWSGDCAGAAACNFAMSADRAVTATFGLLRTLDVALAGPGGGGVTSVPAGVACPGDCTEAFADGTPVALTAVPGPGSYFAGWSGDCAGTGPCNLTMSAARSATATFGLLRTLSVTLAGAGSGGVASVPAGIACPGDCTEAFIENTPVTLTATPAVGSFFVGWSGDCSGSDSCQPVLTADRAVTATFGSLTIFTDGFESNDPCEWSENTGGPVCPP
jgi:hypothetical protein